MTLLPVANHPNFTVAQFDTAVDRAHRNDLRVVEVVKGVAFVTSGSRSNRLHRVTRTTCTCEGHKMRGRCAHRALCIFLCDMMGGFASASIPANVRFLHTRQQASVTIEKEPA
jgi:hypothetical protein